MSGRRRAWTLGATTQPCNHGVDEESLLQMIRGPVHTEADMLLFHSSGNLNKTGSHNSNRPHAGETGANLLRLGIALVFPNLVPPTTNAEAVGPGESGSPAGCRTPARPSTQRPRTWPAGSNTDSENQQRIVLLAKELKKAAQSLEKNLDDLEESADSGKLLVQKYGENVGLAKTEADASRRKVAALEKAHAESQGLLERAERRLEEQGEHIADLQLQLRIQARWNEKAPSPETVRLETTAANAGVKFCLRSPELQWSSAACSCSACRAQQVCSLAQTSSGDESDNSLCDSLSEARRP